MMRPAVRLVIFATLATLCALAAGLVFSGAPALAVKIHAFSGSFGGPCTGAGDTCEPGQLAEPLSEPSGVAVNDSTGRVYVLDKGNGRVVYFSASGSYEGQFNGSLAPSGPFGAPDALAVAQSNGDVWVADTGHNVVDEFTGAGGYVMGSQLTGPTGGTVNSEPFDKPDGLAVDPNDGDLYVAEHREDFEFGPVSVFEPAGPPFALKTQFESAFRPWSVAIDSESNVYVAEAGAEQVDKYSALGASHLTNYLGMTEFIYATPATEAPRAVAVDLSDNELYTAANSESEEEGGVVNAYDSSGRLIESFGAGHIISTGETHPLRGIAVDPSTHAVYVADAGGNDVDIFVEVEGPTATTEAPATEVTATSATLPGTVNPNEAPLTECLFEYGNQASYGQSKTCEQTVAEIGAGDAPKAVSAQLTGLVPNQTYHYQLFTTNASAPGRGGDETFKTESVRPAVNDSPPSVSARRTTAVFRGTVNPENSSTEYDFQYVRAAEYEPSAPDPYSAGAETPNASAGQGFGDVPVRPQTVVELQPETTYDYRLVATNETGTEPGPDYTFTTAPRTPPLVSTGAASAVSQTGASISGTVDPEGIQTSYAFEVGTDTSYSGARLYGNAGQGEGPEPITVALQDLAPATTYHYRLIAANADGTAYGQDMTFTTPSVPSPIAQPLTLALLASPAIAFPTETRATTTTTTKPLTRAQKLAKALKQCKKDESKSKRAKCEKQARKRYGTKAKTK